MALLPPTGLTGAYQNKNRNANTLQIKITWVAPVGSDPYTHYRIYKNDVLLDTLDPTDTEYLDEETDATVNYVTYYMTTYDDADPAHTHESAISVTVTNYSIAFEDLITRLRDSYLMDSPADPRMKRWTDEQLLEYLNMGLDDVNTAPPMSAYSIETLPSGWRSLVLMRAKFEALTSRASIETAKEFNFAFGGVSVAIERSSKYLAVSTAEWTAYNERLTKAKLASVMFTCAPGGILTSDMPFKIRVYAPRQYRVR